MRVGQEEGRTPKHRKDMDKHGLKVVKASDLVEG